MEELAKHRVTFKGGLPWNMEVFVTNDDRTQVPLRMQEATITIKPNQTSAHIKVFRPTLDLSDIPTHIEVVTPEDIRREQKELQVAAKEAFDAWLSEMDRHDDRYHQIMMSQLDSTRPRFFLLHRKQDQTGVSGTGFIAAGIEYQDGLRYARPVHLFWMGQFPTKGEYTDILELLAIHNHDGNTEIVWLEYEGEKEHVTNQPTKS